MSKLPPIKAFFWIMKICTTNLGQTAGYLLSMTLHVGYAVSTTRETMTSLAGENAKFIAFCLWLKLNRQHSIPDCSTLTEKYPIPPYDDPLY
jgi:uncharacterized membrane-anchored protein